MLHFARKCDIITLEKKRGDLMTDRMIFLDTLRESLQKQLDALDVYMNTVAREDYDKMSEEEKKRRERRKPASLAWKIISNSFFTIGMVLYINNFNPSSS